MVQRHRCQAPFHRQKIPLLDQSPLRDGSHLVGLSATVAEA